MKYLNLRTTGSKDSIDLRICCYVTFNSCGFSLRRYMEITGARFMKGFKVTDESDLNNSSCEWSREVWIEKIFKIPVDGELEKRCMPIDSEKISKVVLIPDRRFRKKYRPINMSFFTREDFFNDKIIYNPEQHEPKFKSYHFVWINQRKDWIGFREIGEGLGEDWGFRRIQESHGPVFFDGPYMPDDEVRERLEKEYKLGFCRHGFNLYDGPVSEIKFKDFNPFL